MLPSPTRQEVRAWRWVALALFPVLVVAITVGLLNQRRSGAITVGAREVVAFIALVLGGSAVGSIWLTYMFWGFVNQLRRVTGESEPKGQVDDR